MSKSPVLRLRFRAAILSLLVGALMLLGKIGAYVLTGSAAILSDALESVVHIAATAFALFSVVLAARPADPSHPYGHGKIEYFSAGFEGALIILAAVAIIVEASRSLLYGFELTALDTGAVIIAAAGVINLALGSYLIRVGRTTHSLTLEADGRHVLTDSYTSLGVVIGLLLVMATGWDVLDPLIAMAVALNILITGSRLIYRSVRGLMDAADPEQLQVIVDALSAHRRPGWIDVHRLRMLRIGDAYHVDLHLTVPRFWDVERTHDEQGALEDRIDATLEGTATVLTHLDPCKDACCSFCDYDPCPVRAHPCAQRRSWDLDKATAPAEYEDEHHPSSSARSSTRDDAH